MRALDQMWYESGECIVENIIIVFILVSIVLLAFRGSVKHFRREGGCCGGGSSVKPLKKKLKNKIVKKYTLEIDGMHCQNCANAVTRAVNDIEGATAMVKLRKKEARISCDRDVDPETIIQAIGRKGYSAREKD